MFQIHGLAGPLFTTPRAEALRRVGRVPGVAAAPVEETDAVVLSARVAEEQRRGGHPDGSPRHAAVQAYAQLQGQGTAPAPTRRRPRVSDWMTQPVHWLPLDQTAAQALADLAMHGIGQAPVLDERQRLVGLLLRHDAATAPADTTLVHTMRSPVPAAGPDTDLRELSLALLQTGLPGLPVTSPQGELVGFITRGDVLRAVATEPALDLWG